MTLTEALQAIHRLYQADVNYPESTEDDYQLRVGLLNDAIGVWEREGDGRWPELYTTLAAAATGTKTTTAGATTLTAPTDFSFMHGYVRIDDANGASVYYAEVPRDKAHLFDNDTVTNFYYVTGNRKDGFVVNIHPAMEATGRNVAYEYYKTADRLSSGSDVIEMSDPYYAVYYALSIMFEADGEGDRAIKALDQSTDRIEQMRIQRMVAGAYQDSTIPDPLGAVGVSGFGV